MESTVTTLPGRNIVSVGRAWLVAAGDLVPHG